MKNPFSIVYGQDYIAIKRNGKEVLYWAQEEWEEDNTVVFSIFRAIELASKNKLDSILLQIKILQKIPRQTKKKVRWTAITDIRTGKTKKCKIYDGRHF